MIRLPLCQGLLGANPNPALRRNQKLDAKNRVTLPAKLRQHFADGVIVAKGVDRCLSVYTPAAFEAFVDQQLGSLSPFSAQIGSPFTSTSHNCMQLVEPSALTWNGVGVPAGTLVPKTHAPLGSVTLT